MTVEKITISIPSETLARARGAIRRGRASSMSAYVSSAVERQVKDDDLVAMLDEMLAETGGPPTPAEESHVARVLGLKVSAKRRR